MDPKNINTPPQDSNHSDTLTPPLNLPKKNRKSNKFIIILILLFLLLVFPVISYIIYDFDNIVDKSNPCVSEGKLCPSGEVVERARSNNCEFPTCPLAQEDVSNIWTMTNLSDSNRLFENSKFNYSFEAPSDWKFMGSKYGFELFSPNYEKRGDLMGNLSVHSGSQIEYNSSFESINNISNLEDWYEKEGRKIYATRAPYKKNNSSFAGKTALEILIIREDYTSKKYVFIKKGGINSITFSTFDKRSAKNHQPVFNQITSSFKFLD